ncbi:MAG TPA: peptidoglycan-binding protein [Chthoniobacterales bacterium]
MKALWFSSTSRLIAGILAASVALLAMPSAAHADSDWKRKKKHGHYYGEYYRYPRSSFTVTFGTGYRGRGYYYGPPGAAYYYDAPGVVYYRTRSAVPRGYWGDYYYDEDRGGRWSVEARVQRALSRRGYYYGPIDGDIGPGSRRAIARYQAQNGLRVTGTITRGVLRSLGI